MNHHLCHWELLSVFEGRMKDDATLRENKIAKGSKIMVVGSTVTDVLAVNEPARKPVQGTEKVESSSSKEPLCRQKVKRDVDIRVARIRTCVTK